MHYFAGIFDAEGWVSLLADGHFVIGLEMTNEDVIILFQHEFGGRIYKKERSNRKIIYSWILPTDRDSALDFIDKIERFTQVKNVQLIALEKYLNQTREKRRETRSEFKHQIAEFKKPAPFTKKEFDPRLFTKKPDDNFWQWFAGFMDGDGNFTVYEYQNGPRRTFDSWIGAFNVFGEPIQYINHRIEGSISRYKGSKFPVWKWVCNQADSEMVCSSLEPYLIVKKQQCRLVSEYLKIHKTKIRGIDHSDQTIIIIRDIIKQIKHHNSL